MSFFQTVKWGGRGEGRRGETGGERERRDVRREGHE